MTTKMRPIRETISLDEARARIAAAVRPIERTERVPLSDANGRVLAQDVVAAADVPPFDRAAMDGYAVRAEDSSGATREQPRTLRRIETLFTGQVSQRTIGPGECIEIATGAPMPAGADAVVIVEETDGEASGAVLVFSPVSPRQNVGPQGADIRRGQHVLQAGTTFTPSRVGAAAALGLIEVAVYGRPRVAILSTGNEIVEPGQPLNPGQIYDVNRFTLSAVVADHGGEPVAYRTSDDTLADLSRALDGCLAEDLLVFSGGSSVGERDLILDLLAARGEVIFHGIAVKPGKPTAFGRVSGKLFFGMPGYPTSCLSNAYILLVSALRRMARLAPQAVRSVALPLSQRIASAPGRHQFYTVRIVDGTAVPAFKASGDITSMSKAEGYIEIPAGTDIVDKGDIVEVKLF
ncbi:MAG: molybdopterin molybdenumtransferase MoeA [Acidobacteria bacterium]|nr:molybdopterin molybdenumtransferase MoeA [Acidobacteriota bacterium]